MTEQREDHEYDRCRNCQREIARMRTAFPGPNPFGWFHTGSNTVRCDLIAAPHRAMHSD